MSAGNRAVAASGAAAGNSTRINAVSNAIPNITPISQAASTADSKAVSNANRIGAVSNAIPNITPVSQAASTADSRAISIANGLNSRFLAALSVATSYTDSKVTPVSQAASIADSKADSAARAASTASQATSTADSKAIVASQAASSVSAALTQNGIYDILDNNLLYGEAGSATINLGDVGIGFTFDARAKRIGILVNRATFRTFIGIT